MRNPARLCAAFVTAIAVVSASIVSGALAAQVPARTADGAPQKSITVIGCLQQAGAAGGAAGTAGPGSTGVPGVTASPVVGQFILVDAQESSAPATTSGAAGTTGSSAPRASGGSRSAASTEETTSYRLQGHASDLRKLVGQHVEVVGQLAPTSSADSRVEGDTRAGRTRNEPVGGDAAPATTAVLPMMDVESVRLIAPACSR
jgi:hypothetical protein